MTTAKFMIINGPNLNLLGTREPEIYGDKTLEEIQAHTTKLLEKSGHTTEVEWYQSNIEGEIVNKIQSAINSNINALIINPAGYTYTSVAILDALKTLNCPIVEVHISNTHKREEFRTEKLTTKASNIIIEGAGKNSYYLAILSQLIKKEE